MSCFATHWPLLMVRPDPGYMAFHHPPAIFPQVQTQAPPNKNGSMRLSEGYFMARTVSNFRRWALYYQSGKFRPDARQFGGYDPDAIRFG